MLTRKRVFISTVFVAGLLLGEQTSFAKRSSNAYQSFELPQIKLHSVDGPGKLFVSSRLSLKNRVHQRVPKIDNKKFLFAKEAFVSEKREEAIKLLRQQLDSGLRANRENILLRLGQLYAEKYMELSYQETEVYTAKLQEYEKNKAEGKKVSPPKLGNSRSRRYLQDALKLFYDLERQFPKHPKIDEVLFFIGFVEMEAGNRDKGARYLERVVKQYPRSRKIEDALISLADYYFDRSDFKHARSRYEVLAQQKNSPMHFYAVYKLAWCDLNLRNGARALTEMKRLVRDLEGEKDTAKFNLREQAIRDLVIFYSDAGTIDDAMEFFTDTVGKEKAVANLRIMADSMRSKARDGEAIQAYQRLMREAPNSREAPLIQLGIYESLQRLEKTSKAVESLVWALDHYGPESDWAKDFSGDKGELKSTLKTLEEEGAKAAFFYHASAQKGSNKALYRYALVLYEALLRDFPNHPDKKKFCFFRAEVLYGEKKWLEAADSYMEAAHIAPKDKMTDEAVYNALLALDQLTSRVDKINRYTEDEQKKMDLSPRDIPKGEQRFIEIAHFYLKEYPAGARVVDVHFRIAAIYYRYHHFDKARELFEKIALEHPRHRSATTAAYIVLDVLNMEKNYDELDETAHTFAKTQGLGDAKFRAEMKEISDQIGFKKVEKLEANNEWKKAAESYLAVYKNNPSGTLSEKALYNALISFEKAGDITKSNEVSRQFVAKYPKSKYTEQLMLTMSKNAEKVYDFEEARQRYYSFYQNHPKSKEAPKALYNSAVFSELLEHPNDAIDRYQQYLKLGIANAEERRAIEISLAKMYRKQGNWSAYSQAYHRLIQQSSKITEKLGFLAELVHQYELAGRASEKSQALRELRALYQSSGKSAKDIGMAAQYVAEAEWMALSSQRKKYDETTIRFPVQDLVYLVGLKQRRLKNLGKAYDQVIDIGVPEWGVAALRDKATAFAAYGEEFRKVQIPGKMKGTERQEADAGLKKIEQDIVKPLDNQAREFFRLCADKASEFHVATRAAMDCQQHLQASTAPKILGQIPQPNIESDYFPRWEGTVPPKEDERYIDYLASLTGARLGAAEKKIKSYLAEHPTDKRAAYLLGLHYLKQKKDALAHYFFDALEKDPDFHWKALLYNELGLMALRQKETRLAVDYFEKSTQVRPELGAPYANLGALYLQSGNYSGAESSFRKAEALSRDMEEAALGLGAALEAQGKFDAAHEVYTEYLGEHSRALAVLYNDAMLLGNHLGKRQQALELMQRYIQAGGRESAKAQETIQNWR